MMYFLGRRRVPVELTTITPPVEPSLSDLEDRTRTALRVIRRHLTAQHLLEADDRDDVLIDALLDVRNALQPIAAVSLLSPAAPAVVERAS